MNLIKVLTYVLVFVLGAGCYYMYIRLKISKANADAKTIVEEANTKADNLIKEACLLHKLIGQHQDKHSAKDLMPGHFPAAVVDYRTEKNDRRCSQQFCPMRCTEQREGAVIRPAFCLYRLHGFPEIFHRILPFCDFILQ